MSNGDVETGVDGVTGGEEGMKMRRVNEDGWMNE